MQWLLCCPSPWFPKKDAKQATSYHRRRRDQEEEIRVRVFGEGCSLPQLISDQTFNASVSKIQAQAKSTAKTRARTKPETWASGFMVSAYRDFKIGADGLLDLEATETRHKMYGIGRGKTKPQAYTCRCRNQSKLFPGDVCELGMKRNDVVNQTLDAYLLALTTGPDLKVAVQRQNKARKAKGGEVSKDLLEARITKLKAKEKRLNSLYIDGELGREDRDKRVVDLRAQEHVIRGELDRIQDAPVEASPEDVASMEPWDPNWDHEAKRAWLLKHVQAIAVSQDGIVRIDVKIPCQGGGVPVYSGQAELWPWAKLPRRMAQAKATEAAA
jgi:hypothetical protein